MPQPMLAKNPFWYHSTTHERILMSIKEDFQLTLRLSLLMTHDALWLQGFFTFKSCSFLTTPCWKCKEKDIVDFRFLFSINPKQCLADIVCIKTFCRWNLKQPCWDEAKTQTARQDGPARVLYWSCHRTSISYFTIIISEKFCFMLILQLLHCRVYIWPRMNLIGSRQEEVSR